MSRFIHHPHLVCTVVAGILALLLVLSGLASATMSSATVSPTAAPMLGEAQSAAATNLFMPVVQGYDPYPGPTNVVPSPTPTLPPATPTPTPDNPGSVVAEVTALTNQHRAAAGCPALTINAQLNAAAQRHSNDMATHDFMSHTGSDGSSPWDRMQDAGYSFSNAAENVAAGYASAEAVVTAWMGSEGHRANILNCNLREIGIGYAYNAASSYRHYWTQAFGTR